jgi:hypothetical protein
MHIRTPLIIGAMLAASAQSVHAQTPVDATARTVVPFVGFSFGAASIASDRAALAQVGERSWGIQLDGGVTVKRYFTLGFDIGGQFLKDHAQFTQNTTGGEMKSTASVTYFSAITGARTPAFGPLALGLNVGASGTIATRSIENCTDCHVDKLTIPAGGFVEPVLLIAVRKFHVRVVDRIYAGDGMQSVMSVGAQIALPKKKN